MTDSSEAQKKTRNVVWIVLIVILLITYTSSKFPIDRTGVETPSGDLSKEISQKTGWISYICTEEKGSIKHYGNPLCLAILLANGEVKPFSAFQLFRQYINLLVPIDPSEILGFDKRFGETSSQNSGVPIGNGKYLSLGLADSLDLLILIIFLRYLATRIKTVRIVNNKMFTLMRKIEHPLINVLVFILLFAVFGFIFFNVPILNIILFWPIRWFGGIWAFLIMPFLNGWWLTQVLGVLSRIPGLKPFLYDSELEKRLSSPTEEQEAKIKNTGKNVKALVEVANAANIAKEKTWFGA